MFNTMTVTKAAGALIGSLLFLLLTSWAASGLYHVGPSGHVDTFTRDNLPQDLVARMTQQLDRGIAQVAEVARWLKILEDQHPDILELDG